MKNCFSTKRFWIPILQIILMFYASSTFASEWLRLIEGNWQVVEVHINTEATSKSQYYWNDPRLTGRLFNFKENGFWGDVPESADCANLNVHPIKTKLGELIKVSMAGYGYPASQPNAGDYEIHPADAESTLIFRIYCGQALWHSELGTNVFRGAWLVPLKHDRLMLRWFGETLLVLRRVPKNMRAQPSFSCVHAKNRTEHVICASYELSAFDQSVSDAYHQLLRQAQATGEDKTSIVKDQAAWLKIRNHCVVDQKCLIKSMRDRLEIMASKIQI